MASKTWSKKSRCPPATGSPNWQEGDIAFLKPSNAFRAEDRRALIDRTPEYPKGYIPVQATSHPVIILARLSRASTHALITTVSAYGSGPENHYRAPWKQRQHRGKARADFRSFAGSELPTATSPPLRLRPGQAMRKPRASWVYVPNAWVVPLTVLGRFSGVEGGDVVGMTPESLGELRTHMAERCGAWSDCQARLLAAEKSCSSGPSAAVLAVAPAANPAAAPLSPSPPVKPRWREKDKKPWEVDWRRGIVGGMLRGMIQDCRRDANFALSSGHQASEVRGVDGSGGAFSLVGGRRARVQSDLILDGDR
ncbi:uncharacterized protein B0H64DRAFT_433490 [Chaetomium fimeti]|uniref:Uncharacterized protein n=1 Tax=Chaetomium fimeti TaxID=1854472 RepID=A0AAE0LRK8_9PEZI|nr:hypothetical protein B0H64DRAFT_433490 [Chaetomium fimeti]